MVAQQNQAVIKVIPVNDQGEVILEEYQRLLGPRTKLVALTQASNSLGTILPTQEMTSMAKRYGAKVLIDGAQSVAHIPVDLNTLECDFFVFSGHKIFGPTGIGAVFIRESLHDILPPWQGGGNMIQNVTFEETTYNGAPAKFERQVLPTLPMQLACMRLWIMSIESVSIVSRPTNTNFCSMLPKD